VLVVLALTGMTKEIVYGLPRPWPEDLPERVTRPFVHGISDGSWQLHGDRLGFVFLA
jgi:hypothetical protein